MIFRDNITRRGMIVSRGGGSNSQQERAESQQDEADSQQEGANNVMIAWVNIFQPLRKACT